MATGAAASDFGYERAARHERLLSELVYEVLREEVNPAVSPEPTHILSLDKKS